MWIFVYGSLLDAGLLAHRAGEPRLSGLMRPALLAKYRRVRLRHSYYPTLRRDPGHAVEGKLVRLNADALRRLSAWEGPRYHLCHRTVGTRGGPVRAGVWIAPGATARPWAQPWRRN